MASGYLTTGTHVIFEPNEKLARVEGREGVRLTEMTPGQIRELRFNPGRKK